LPLLLALLCPKLCLRWHTLQLLSRQNLLRRQSWRQSPFRLYRPYLQNRRLCLLQPK
jgi:hypothetical protein